MLSGLTWVQGHSVCTPWGDSSRIWVHWNLLTSIDSHFGLFQQHSLAMLSWSEYFWRLILLSTHIVSTVSFHKHCPFLKISPHPGKRWLQHGASEERKGQTWGLRLDLKSSRTGGCRKAQSRLPCSEHVMGLRQQHHCCGPAVGWGECQQVPETLGKVSRSTISLLYIPCRPVTWKYLHKLPNALQRWEAFSNGRIGMFGNLLGVFCFSKCYGITKVPSWNMCLV